MKKFILGVVMALVATTASALGPNVFNHLGLGVGVGLTGITIEAATPITSFVQFRAGVSIMPGIKFNANTEVEYTINGMDRNSDVDLQGNLKRVQGQAIVNIYPIPGAGFFIAGGAYFGGSELVKVTGHCEDLVGQATDGGIVIGDYKIPADANGNVSGGIRVKSFRPYLGIGFGRSVPGKLMSFTTELGVQFHGKPYLYTDNGELEVPERSDDDDTFQKIMDKVKVYPNLTFRLSFRAF